MSTRSNILVGENQFYHHWDGYPEGVGTDLAYFVANVNAGYIDNWNSDLDKLAEYIRYSGIPGRLATERGVDHAYEYEPKPGLHGDIEYLYLIDGEKGDYKLYCVDVWDYIKKSGFEGPEWDHPFFDMTPKQLRKNFCTREYEFLLPIVDVPEDRRMYQSVGIFSHREAEFCGMKKNLKYGETDYDSGFVRVRNIRGRLFRWWKR